MENTNYDFDRICRACKAETSDLQSIFEINNSVKNESSKLSEMMMECTSVQILVGDGLPNSMCVQCVVKLKNAYDFKKQCEVTDTSLRFYMQQKKIKIEEQDDDSFDDQSISQVLHEKIEPPHESVLSCAACPKKFTTLLGLKTHKKSHEKENSLKCKICLKEFTYYSHLQRHMNIHNPQKIYICKICEKRLTRLEHLKRHMVTHLKTKPHACRICKRGFNHIENLYNHEKRCKGDKKYVCEICNRGFTRADALEAHMGNHEQAGNVKPMLDSLDNIDNYIKVESFDGETVDIQDFIEPQVIIEDFKSSDLISKCEKTNLEIPEEELLKLNVACSEDDLKLTELADIPIVRKRGRPRKNEVRPPRNLRNSAFKATNCRVCQRKFKRLSHLQRHMLSHGESKAFQCELCWKTFGRKDHMVRHMKLHSVKKEFKCELCSREFVREEQLIQHKAVKHDIGQRIVVEKKYKCPICTKSFTTEKYRDIHVEAHGKEKRKIYDCKNCHLIFNSKEEFAEHEKQSPECSKKFLCSECGQRFIRKNYLIVHMRRHRGEKPFKCKYCGKGFPRSTDVTRHEKYHTGEKNHLCIICGKGFGRAYNLTLHMRTHTGEKPYHCSYCDAAFAQSNDLKSHTRRHTGERYHCDLCTDTFLMGYLLKQHKRNVHGLDLPSQRVQPAHVLQSMQNMQQAVQNAMPAMPIPRPS